MKIKYFYGYNIVAASFLIQGICIGAMFTYGVFFKELQQAFGWSRALISGASSLAFFVMGVGAMIAGTLNDKIGPRIILTVSGASIGLGYLLMSQLSLPWQLYLLYGLFAGIGFSTHDVNTLSTVARWFVKTRGMMTGLVKVGTGIGQFVIPLIASALIAAYGWRNAYLMVGGFVLLTLIALAQFMKRDPSKIGLLPDGNAQSRFCDASPVADHSLSLREALRTKQFWGICFAEFAIFFCLFTVLVHIVPHAMDQGLKPAMAASVLSTIGGASILGRLVMGMVNDKIGGRKSLMVCFMVLISSLVLLLFTGSAGMLFLFAVVYGLAHGGIFTVMSPMLAEFFGMRSHGQLFGTVLFAGTIGATIGPILTGHVFDITGEYRMAFMALTGFAISGFMPILFLRPIKVGDAAKNAGSQPMSE
ncbi:MAG: sugar phosphate permease [Proteobacteria bacterium]|nr:sugar phosphate permease [Pseudomonadota bacterium]